MKFKCWNCAGIFESPMGGQITPGVWFVQCSHCYSQGAFLWQDTSRIYEFIETAKAETRMTSFECQMLGYMKEIVERLPKQMQVVIEDPTAEQRLADLKEHIRRKEYAEKRIRQHEVEAALERLVRNWFNAFLPTRTTIPGINEFELRESLLNKHTSSGLVFQLYIKLQEMIGIEIAKINNGT